MAERQHRKLFACPAEDVLAGPALTSAPRAQRTEWPVSVDHMGPMDRANGNSGGTNPRMRLCHGEHGRDRMLRFCEKYACRRASRFLRYGVLQHLEIELLCAR